MDSAGLVSRDNPRTLRKAAARLRGMAEGFEAAQQLLDGAAASLRASGPPVLTGLQFQKFVQLQQAVTQRNAVSARQAAEAFEQYAAAIERVRADLQRAARQMPQN